MYKVQFSIQRSGYRKRRIEGIYIPPDPPLSVPEMKRDCTEFVRRRLEERDPAFRQFNIDLTIFKRLRTDFLCNARKIEE